MSKHTNHPIIDYPVNSLIPVENLSELQYTHTHTHTETMVNHNRIFTNSKWTSALSIHLWCFIYVYIEKSCWFGVCWVTIDTYSLPSALKTELPAQSIFITMRGWRGKEIPELKHPSGCLCIQSFTPSSYTQFNWALCSNQSYICCVSTFSAVQCFNLTPAWAVNQSICLTLAHSKHVFTRWTWMLHFLNKPSPLVLHFRLLSWEAQNILTGTGKALRCNGSFVCSFCGCDNFPHQTSKCQLLFLRCIRIASCQHSATSINQNVGRDLGNSVVNYAFSNLVLGRRPKEGCFSKTDIQILKGTV